ncbi:MAG: CamS family sex pheromone protein [Bacilli bacterium]
MKKQWISFFVALAIMISGCSMKPGGTEVGEGTDGKSEVIIPKYTISNDYYRVVLPFKPSEARGLNVATMNNRLDLNEFEDGLLRISQEVFDTDKYFYQEGQYLKKDQILEWLQRSKSAKPKQGESADLGLNPKDDGKGTLEERNARNPLYVSSILEQNFLVKTKDDKLSLGGISIGIGLNSVHYFNQEDGYPREYRIPDADLIKEGKRIAQEVIKRVRAVPELANVPIVVGLFKQGEKSSLVPGHYLMYADLDKGKTTISDWKNVNEEYVLFPSKVASNEYRENSAVFNNFKKDIEDYFPNYTGVIGEGYYVNNQLVRLEISIPIQFYSRSEIIGFTQYVTGLVMEHFPNYIEVSVAINSSRGEESIIVRKQDAKEPFVYIH